MANNIQLGYAEFPFLTFTNEKNEPDGCLIRLFDEIITKNGYTYDAVSYPGKRLHENLKTGLVQVWMGIPQYAPKNETYVGDAVIMTIVLGVYHLQSTPQIEAKEELMGKSVVILNGYSYGGIKEYITNPRNRIEYYSIESREQARQMLASGRVDYLLDYKRPMDATFNGNELSALAYKELASWPCHFVVSKRTPGAKALIRLLDESYSRLKEEGKLNFDCDR
jgi:ABC-type amino acid transport substrate-binding protein